MSPRKKILILLLFIWTAAGAQTEARLQIKPDQMPQYPGGNKALVKMFSDSIDINVKWEERTDAEENGRLVLQLVINEKGLVEDAKVITSIGAKNDLRCLNLARKLKFKPATANGKPVKVTYTLPLEFEF